MERPILFSAPMVRAILEGRKIQTRRLCKDMNKWVIQDVREVRNERGVSNHYLKGATVALERLNCPYGIAGDTLWVRETWGINNINYLKSIPKSEPHDLDDDDIVYFATESDSEISNEMPRRPSIFMPKWMSRITLKIIETRVERLNEIETMDCVAEGCDQNSDADPRDIYAALWDKINGDGSWVKNPWVWVIEFDVVNNG